MNPKFSVLIIEDETHILNFMRKILTSHDYKVLSANTGKAGLEIISSQCPDIILLDLGLPDLEGVEVIKKIRTWSNMPIIVISARSEDTDKIEALDAGADDYITKPYNPTILLLRIQNIFKRMEISKEDMNYDGIIVNPKKGILEKDGKTLELTKNEMIIFSFLLSNRGKIVTRDDLMTDLWNLSLIHI